ncbi:hypothetical protein [Fibrobacter succinogenes]|uniref:hypothetical protein n=1 Tax=Fibrobacter succinogenes TaxID=833 RepID=UPI001563EC5C|nr:hypothetical protein [Fibrobacter succinogenes]
MKKILALLAICTLVACNESGESSVSGPVGGGTQSGELNADSIRQHVLDSIAMANQSSAVVGPGLSSATVPVFSSSTVAPLVSSSSVVAPPPSSAVIPKSSATVPPKSSSSVVVDDGTIKLELWDGSLGQPHVPVGNKDGGWWYKYDDQENGGASSLEWETEPGEKGDMTPVVEICGGVCGSFSLGGSEDLGYNGYVGFAFGFGKNDSYSGDASKMKGICVEYKATAPIIIELGLTRAAERAIGSANPAYELPKSTTADVVNITWAQFAQPDWYTGTKTVTGSAAAKELSSLKFKITGDDGVRGTFNIMKVGPYGECL